MGSHNGHGHMTGHTPAIHEHADAWHHHDPSAEGIPQGEHGSIASAGTIAKWYVALVVTIAATVILVVMYFSRYSAEYRQQMEERSAWTNLAQEARSYKATALGELAKPGTIGETGYRLPIDAAMEKVIREYKGASK